MKKESIASPFDMSELEEELYDSVNRGDVNCIKELLRKGANVNTLVRSGQTILGQAVKLGNLEVIETLLHAEDFLPPDDEPSASRDDSASVDEALSRFLQHNDASFYQSEADSMTESRHDENDVMNSSGVFKGYTFAKSDTKARLSPNESLMQLPFPSQRGLGLFQSLRRFTAHRRKTDVNLPDFYDRMPIHYAAESGKPEMLELLLKAGCRVNVSDSENITPLHLAVSRGHEEITEILLRAGSRVNSKTSDKSSALHIAASRGYLRIVEKLLDNGAKVDILDASERTPLLLAVNRAHYDVVRLLVERGAKVNVEEIHGYTPLSEAVFLKNINLVKILLNAGAKVSSSHYLLHHAILHHSVPLTHLLLHSGAVVNVRDDGGDTPMHIAVKSMQIPILQELIKYGADVNMCNGLSGQTLIHEAVDEIREVEYAFFRTVLEVLLNRGCNLNAESLTKGDTPLYRAILKQKFAFAAELIRQGSDVNSGNVYSCNIDNLCLARRQNDFRTVKLLVYAGFNMWRTPWLEILPCPIAYNCSVNTVKGWLVYMKRNPLNLVDLCRIAVRRTLGQNLVVKVNRLTIPSRIKDFLLLRDISDSEYPVVMEDNSNANLPLL